MFSLWESSRPFVFPGEYYHLVKLTSHRLMSPGIFTDYWLSENGTSSIQVTHVVPVSGYPDTWVICIILLGSHLREAGNNMYAELCANSVLRRTQGMETQSGKQCKHVAITLYFYTEQISQPASEAEGEENNTWGILLGIAREEPVSLSISDLGIMSIFLTENCSRLLAKIIQNTPTPRWLIRQQNTAADMQVGWDKMGMGEKNSCSLTRCPMQAANKTNPNCR